MIGAPQLAIVLRRIQADMAALVASAHEHPIDAHELYILTIKVGCQAELLEKGLVD